MIYHVYYQRFFGLLRPDEIRGNWVPFTHRLVRTVEANALDDLFTQMQGENWSRHGEARPLIERLHLSHTSMSVGDVAQAETGQWWLCNYRGWTLLNTPEWLSQTLWMSTEADFQHRPPQMVRIKITDEVDCLPADAYTVEQLGGVGFSDLIRLAPLLEQRLGVAVCLDLGTDFYETEPRN